MIQQANETQVRPNEVTTNNRMTVGQILLAIFKGSFKLVLAIGRSVAAGCRVFMSTAEEHGLHRQ